MRKCQVYYCVPFKAHKNTTAGGGVEADNVEIY